MEMYLAVHYGVKQYITQTCLCNVQRFLSYIITFSVDFLAHLSRRLIGELIGYSWSGVRPSVRRRTSSTFSNLNISATSSSIVTKFYLKHYWVGGKDALDFGPDRIRTLVSMATDSSHRVIMGKML